MKLTSNNVVGLFVDPQEKIVPAMSNPSKFVTYLHFLLRGLDVHKVPLVLTRQYPKGLGNFVEPIVSFAEGAKVFDKTSFSCLDEPTIREYFENDARSYVLLAGIETHICVQQTAFDLLDLGKKVVLIADCVDSRRQFDSEIALNELSKLGIRILTAESVLFELTRKSEAPEFKAISKLAKELK